MSQKFLFIVDHFLKFPTSEYGGLWNVVASDGDEVFDLITEYDNESYPEHYGKLRENIINSRKFKLADDVESCVVEAFLT